MAIYSLDVLLPNLEPALFPLSSVNCCFLTCTHISQEAGKVVWYSHLLKNFPQFVVIHSVKGFGVVNKAEIDVFLELSCFFYDPADVGNLTPGFSAFSKSSLNIWKISVHLSGSSSLRAWPRSSPALIFFLCLQTYLLNCSTSLVAFSNRLNLNLFSLSFQ